MTALMEVTKTATCSRCGYAQVAWVQGAKSGKWYLAQAYLNSATGQVEVDRFDFHSKRCAQIAADRAAQPQPVVPQTPKTAGPSLAQLKERFAEVPEGRYALGEDADPRFYQVRRPTKGNWEGYVFVDRLIGNPGGYRKVPVRGLDADAVLTAVEVDPMAAMVRFGLLSGTCGKCGADLSDPQSLERGIGPDCWKTMADKVV